MLRLLGRIIPAKKRPKLVIGLGLVYEIDGRPMVIAGFDYTWGGGNHGLTVQFVTVEEFERMLKEQAN